MWSMVWYLNRAGFFCHNDKFCKLQKRFRGSVRMIVNKLICLCTGELSHSEGLSSNFELLYFDSSLTFLEENLPWWIHHIIVIVTSGILYCLLSQLVRSLCYCGAGSLFLVECTISLEACLCTRWLSKGPNFSCPPDKGNWEQRDLFVGQGIWQWA